MVGIMLDYFWRDEEVDFYTIRKFRNILCNKCNIYIQVSYDKCLSTSLVTVLMKFYNVWNYAYNVSINIRKLS